jgi:hypothetical protein
MLTAIEAPKACAIVPPIPYGSIRMDGTERVTIVKPALRKGRDRQQWQIVFAMGYALVEYSHGGRLSVHTRCLTPA